MSKELDDLMERYETMYYLRSSMIMEIDYAPNVTKEREDELVEKIKELGEKMHSLQIEITTHQP